MTSRHRFPTAAIGLCLFVLATAVTSAGLIFPGGAAQAQTVIPVPPGNRSVEQPAVSPHAVQRTRQTKGSFEGKYKRIYKALKRDKRLLKNIKKVAGSYGIDPVHMIGAIIGEHTYNVDSVDHIQGYYIKALEYAGTTLTFANDGEHVTKFVERPQFQSCRQYRDSFSLWTCRERIWNTTFRGKTVDGKSFANIRFGQAFFQPLYAGQTFGLGQLNPLTALKVTDIVSQRSGFKKLSVTNASHIYSQIMNPDTTLHYMAAVIWRDINTYRKIAGFDISQNPGVTATLYNLGDAPARAVKLRAINKKRSASGQKPILPRENYYGWLVNDKIDELRALL